MLSTPVRSRIRLWIVPAAFVLALAGPAVEEATAQSGGAVTQADCEAAWNSASASLTCSSGSITLSVGQCRIIKECQVYEDTEGGTHLEQKSNDVTVPLDDVDDLNNCDGYLQVGAC